MGEKYREYLAGRRVLKVPMKIVVEKALLDLKPTEEEHAEVSNFPYRELVGTIAFPTNHTKIECKCAVAVLSRFLHNWTRTCIEAALDLISFLRAHPFAVCQTCVPLVDLVSPFPLAPFHLTAPGDFPQLPPIRGAWSWAKCNLQTFQV